MLTEIEMRVYPYRTQVPNCGIPVERIDNAILQTVWFNCNRLVLLQMRRI